MFNFLSSIFKPSLKDSVKNWGYQLQSIHPDVIAKCGYDMLVIDANDDDGIPFTPEKVEYMKTGVKYLVSYISLGEAENYRPYWNKAWDKKKPVWLGPENKEWPGNYTIKQFWHPDWWNITTSILDSVMASGFDGIYVDKIDVYSDLGGTDELKELMIEYMIKISDYCKSKNPNFIIIAQNAEELGLDSRYLDVVDGIAKESLFYSGELDCKQTLNNCNDINYSADCLNKFKYSGKLVLCVEYVDKNVWPLIRSKYSNLGYVACCEPKLLDSLNIIPV